MSELLATIVDDKGMRIWWLHTVRTTAGRLVSAGIECSWYIGPEVASNPLFMGKEIDVKDYADIAAYPALADAIDDLEHRRNTSDLIARHGTAEFTRGYAWGIYQGVHSIVGALADDGILDAEIVEHIRSRFLA